MPTTPSFLQSPKLVISPGAILGVWACVALPWMWAWWALSGLAGWPSNDDPFYAKPLALWAERGQWQWVRQYGALTASSIAHVATGLLVTGSQYFSYRALFLVCIVQQSLGAVALFVAARGLKVSVGIAWLAAFTLSTFPLYFGHAFTYMTDGPATAWGAIACACAALGVVRGDWRWLCAASAATGWGYWIRQTDGLLLLAPLVALSLLALQARGSAIFSSSRFTSPRSSSSSSAGAAWRGPGLRDFAALLLVPVAAALVLESGWLFSSSLVRARDVAPRVGSGYGHRMLIAAYGWMLICGWYALPWLVLFIAEARRVGRSMPRLASRLCLIGAGLCLLAGLAPLVTSDGRACLTNATGAFIQNAHFGPIFLSDMDEPGRWGTLDGVAWPLWTWQLLSVLSLLSTACLAWWGIATLSHWFVSLGSEAPDLLVASALGFLVMIIAAVVLIVVFVEPHMDRYWMFLLPALSVWWLALAARHNWQLTRPAVAWAAGCLALGLGMSIVFTHDMLAWNNARWRYVHEQLAMGVRPDSIDGGRDVNAWLRMDEDPDTSARAGDASPWWSGRATLALAVGDRPGWHRVESLPWQAWATGRTHHLLVLQRDLNEPGSATDPAFLEVQP